MNSGGLTRSPDQTLYSSESFYNIETFHSYFDKKMLLTLALTIQSSTKVC